MTFIFRQRSKIGSAVIVAIAGMTLTATVNAGASAPPARHSVVQSSGNHHDRDQAIIKLLDPYVVRTDAGTLALNAPQAVTAAIGLATMSKIQSGLAQVNDEIRAGRLVATADHRLHNPNARGLSVQGGWTGLSWQWFGFDMYLSEYYTQKLEAAIAGGVALFGFCMAIPAIANNVACGALAASFALLDAVIWFVDNGNGVIFEYYWWASGTVYAQ